MSDPNIYAIYNADGNLITLRTLFSDGISPFDLDFRMRDGSAQFEEYGFEEFHEQIEKMLVQGR